MNQSELTFAITHRGLLSRRLIAVLLILAWSSPLGAFRHRDRRAVDARDQLGRTPLMLAASDGDADRVRALIAAGADVKARDPNSYTALVYAASSGHADVVRLLLGAGAEKEARNGQALIAAAQFGYAEIVKLLLDAGANQEAHLTSHTSFTKFWPPPQPNEKMPSLWPGFVYYGRSLGGNTITITMPTITLPKDPNGVPIGLRAYQYSGDIPQTALTLAAFNGHPEVVKLLLAAGANMRAPAGVYMGQITKPGISGGIPQLWDVSETALEAAREGSHQDIIDLLKAAGAHDTCPQAPVQACLSALIALAPFSDLTAWKTHWGGTIISAASADQAFRLMSNSSSEPGRDSKVPVPTGSSETNGIIDAAQESDLPRVQALLREKPDLVYIRDKVGATALHYAARSGYKEMAELLIANKAEVNAKDKDGMTPLCVAAGWGQKGVVEVLLAHGAEVNAKTNDGATPLQLAASHGRGDVTELLRQHGGHE